MGCIWPKFVIDLVIDRLRKQRRTKMIKETVVKQLWNDQRSGPAGIFAGNRALGAIRLKSDEGKHLKGTVFSFKKKGGLPRILIGRMCTTETYMASNIHHFANVSRSQHESYKRGKVFYLFITIAGKKIDYWMVPRSVISRQLANLHEKSDGSSHIRIKQRGSRWLINRTDITQYHRSLNLTIAEAKKYAKKRKAAKKAA